MLVSICCMWLHSLNNKSNNKNSVLVLKNTLQHAHGMHSILQHNEIKPVALSAERRTCDREIKGSTPSQAPPRNNTGQVAHTCVPLSPSSISSG